MESPGMEKKRKRGGILLAKLFFQNGEKYVVINTM
jgi:hypothetical protein